MAKRDKILADDPKYMTYYENDKGYDAHTKKPFYNQVVYDYNDGEKHYRISYLRKNTITKERMLDQIKGPKKILAKLSGFDGAYLRFSGQVQLEILDCDRVFDTHQSHGLWEEMYFGETLDV